MEEWYLFKENYSHFFIVCICKVLFHVPYFIKSWILKI